MILVYVTAKDRVEANKIARTLLDKKLIACANIFPIQSLYWWKGKLTKDNECVLILKSVKKNYNKIKKEIKKIHSYEIPCIIKINAKANKEYDNWLKSEVK